MERRDKRIKVSRNKNMKTLFCGWPSYIGGFSRCTTNLYT